MYTEKDIDLAFNESRLFPEMTLEQWKEERLESNVTISDILLVLDKWRGYSHLIQFKKVDAPMRKDVGMAIRKFGIEDCLLAIDHYSEMLQSDYFMNYKWDVRKFFKQSNAAPDFMDNGTKWLNYLKDTKDKFYPWSKLDSNHPRRAIVLNKVSELLARYKDKIYDSIPVTRIVNTQEELAEAKEMAFNGSVKEIFPVIFAHIATNNRVFVDEIISLGGRPFKMQYDLVWYCNAHGETIKSVNIKKEFAALGLE